MRRSTRLKPIARLAERDEEKAAERLRLCREELASYQNRLLQVESYREEYINRFNSAGKGMNASQMKDYRVFIGKLDQAILQMEELITSTEIKCNSGMDDWMAQRARFKALEEVISRYRHEENRQSIRRDEREADERSQRSR